MESVTEFIQYFKLIWVHDTSTIIHHIFGNEAIESMRDGPSDTRNRVAISSERNCQPNGIFKVDENGIPTKEKSTDPDEAPSIALDA